MSIDVNQIDVRPTITDDQRNVPRPDLTQARFIHRPATTLFWDGATHWMPEAWPVIDRWTVEIDE